jgi:integrase/recombinase XerD
MLLINNLNRQEIGAKSYYYIQFKFSRFIYACGLRRSELLNLTKTDILSDRMMIHIRQSKGKKDRVVPLSPLILNTLLNTI